jgi:hypothetical protein
MSGYALGLRLHVGCVDRSEKVVRQPVEYVPTDESG